jgi:acetolactate synthase-1/2/3 large subunit
VQLQSDIETVARNVSAWVRTSRSAGEVGRDAAEAITVAKGPPAQVATLILPADVSWGEGAEPGVCPAAPAQPSGSGGEHAVDEVAAALRSRKRSALLLGGRALRQPALSAAARLAAATGAKLLGEVFPTRLERGRGVPRVERLAYIPELAAVQLDGIRHLILVDAKAPAAFFAYPGREGSLVPRRCQVHELAGPTDPAHARLEQLGELLGAAAGRFDERASGERPPAPSGRLGADSVCQAIGALLPEAAIISDETQTSGVMLGKHTAAAPPHDVLTLTGGAIGQGLPVAVGAAVACPDRPVLALEADGSALYTIQALWTMAREGLNVTTVIFNNRAYSILNLELGRTRAQGADARARAQFDLAHPALDFVAIGNGFGVPSRRAETSEELVAALRDALADPGPRLIEAVVPEVLSRGRLRTMPHALRALRALPRPVATAVKQRVYPA